MTEQDIMALLIESIEEATYHHRDNCTPKEGSINRKQLEDKFRGKLKVLFEANDLSK